MKTAHTWVFELPAIGLQCEAPFPPPPTPAGLWCQETLRLAVTWLPRECPARGPKVIRRSQEPGPGLVSPSCPDCQMAVLSPGQTPDLYSASGP